MKKINIIENFDKQEINNNYLLIDVLNERLNKIKKSKYNIFLILLNIIMIYFIIYSSLRNIEKKLNFIISKYNNTNTELFDNFYSSPDKIYNFISKKYKRLSIIWPLPDEIKFKPFMSENEIKAFSFFMKPGNIYFEFGSGGSTNLASFYKVKTYSVESDVKWHEKLKNNGIVANYITIDLKATSIGYPGNKTDVKDWEKYIKAYKKEYNANIILIDGRFRVACALDIFNKITNQTIILIHDYVNRKDYHIIENYYIKIKSWDTLALFIKNPKIDFISENIYNFYLKDKFL